MWRRRSLLLLILVLGTLIRDGQSQPPSTVGPTTSSSSSATTTGTTVTGLTTPSSSTGTTSSVTAITSTPFTTTTPFTGSTASVLPTPQVGGMYGRCKILSPAPNVTLQNITGSWYVMGYQPATPGNIVDQCDRIVITTTQITLYSLPRNQPISSSPYQSSSAIVQPNVTQGTFLYTLPGYGDPLQGYVTILSSSPSGFIYNVCWLNDDANLQDLILCATSQPDPTIIAGLVANATRLNSNWIPIMQEVNHYGCP